MPGNRIQFKTLLPGIGRWVGRALLAGLGYFAYEKLEPFSREPTNAYYKKDDNRLYVSYSGGRIIQKGIKVFCPHPDLNYDENPTNDVWITREALAGLEVAKDYERARKLIDSKEPRRR